MHEVHEECARRYFFRYDVCFLQLYLNVECILIFQLDLKPGPYCLFHE